MVKQMESIQKHSMTSVIIKAQHSAQSSPKTTRSLVFTLIYHGNLKGNQKKIKETVLLSRFQMMEILPQSHQKKTRMKYYTNQKVFVAMEHLHAQLDRTQNSVNSLNQVSSMRSLTQSSIKTHSKPNISYQMAKPNLKLKILKYTNQIENTTPELSFKIKKLIETQTFIITIKICFKQ